MKDAGRRLIAAAALVICTPSSRCHAGKRAPADIFGQHALFLPAMPDTKLLRRRCGAAAYAITVQFSPAGEAPRDRGRGHDTAFCRSTPSRFRGRDYNSRSQLFEAYTGYCAFFTRHFVTPPLSPRAVNQRRIAQPRFPLVL